MAIMKFNGFEYEFEEKDGEITMEIAEYKRFRENEGELLEEFERLYESLTPGGKKFFEIVIKELYKNQ